MDASCAPVGAAKKRLALRRGAEAESRVARILEAAGWTLRARNWTGAGAELDLVVSRAEVLRFVEVKQRSGSDDSGLDSIDHRKQARLIRAARCWMAREDADAADISFTVAIVGDQGIHWIDAAFDA
jgi:putative endonuclease